MLPPKLRGEIRRCLRGTPGPKDARRFARAILAHDPLIKGHPLSHWLGVITREDDPYWLAYNDGLIALQGAGIELLPLWLDALFQDLNGRLMTAGLIWMARIPHPAALPALKQALKSERTTTRFRALMALEVLAPLPHGLIPLIRRAARDPHWKITFGALRILRAQGLDPDISRPIFEAQLKHTRVEVYRQAALGLGELGEAAFSSLGPIQNCLARVRDRHDARLWAALGQIEPDLVLQPLLNGLLHGGSWSKNAHALMALSRIDARAGLSRLINALPSSWAIAALGQMGDAAASALPSLREIQARDPFTESLIYGAIRDIERGALLPARLIPHTAPQSTTKPAQLLSEIAARGAKHSLAAIQTLAYEAVHAWDEAYALDLPPRLVVRAFDEWLIEPTQARLAALREARRFDLTQWTCSAARDAVSALSIMARDAPEMPSAALRDVYDQTLAALSTDPGAPLYPGDAFDPPPRPRVAAYLAHALERTTPIGG
ncbi:hypothetical protein KKF91_06520 [Myxococcota bacterium]|nr:hypothetical protein [Myxococcota bacterium]MBU1430208.1 hypothetical protein [Myxococcota bacterium]MBU1897914.1 hypothetical protein [Myxococcota bacterium]